MRQRVVPSWTRDSIWCKGVFAHFYYLRRGEKKSQRVKLVWDFQLMNLWCESEHSSCGQRWRFYWNRSCCHHQGFDNSSTFSKSCFFITSILLFMDSNRKTLHVKTKGYLGLAVLLSSACKTSFQFVVLKPAFCAGVWDFCAQGYQGQPQRHWEHQPELWPITHVDF